MNPEVQQAIDNINQYIVENHNNEITANILNPILIELANLFDLVGDLSELDTTEKDSVVSAINWLMTQINSGIEIHVGTDDPNVVPPDNYAVGDLYSRLNVLGDPYKIYMYNGVEWAEIQRVINDLIISNDSTWSSEKISQAIQGDRFETIPTISLSDNDITITNSSWWIQGVNYNLIPDFEDTIPYTSDEGLFRKDIIVAVASNNFVRIEGVESDTNPFEPTVPPNTLLVTQIDVYHDSIGEPTEPIIGSNYIPKASEGWFTYLLNSANPEAIPTISTPFNINFLAFVNNHIVRGLNITSAASKIWHGGMIAIRNHSNYPILIKHLDTVSTAKILFDFPSGEDFLLRKEDGVKYFKLGVIPATGVAYAYCLNDFDTGVSLTLEQARLNGNVFEGDVIFNDELQRLLFKNPLYDGSNNQYTVELYDDGGIGVVNVYNNNLITSIEGGGLTTPSIGITHNGVNFSPIVGHLEYNKQGNRKAFAQISDLEDALEDYIQEPTTDGTSGQVLTTDGSGGRSWTTPTGGITANQTILTQYTESTVSGTAGSNLIQPDLGLPILELEDLQEDSSYSGELVLNIENNNIATAKVIELFGAVVYNNTNPSADITAKITFTLNFFNQVGDDIDYKLSWEYVASGEVLFGEHTDTIDNTSDVDFELIVTGHSTDSFNLKKARLWRN